MFSIQALSAGKVTQDQWSSWTRAAVPNEAGELLDAMQEDPANYGDLHALGSRPRMAQRIARVVYGIDPPRWSLQRRMAHISVL